MNIRKLVTGLVFSMLAATSLASSGLTCRQEMPLLDQLYSRYQRVGFSLLGVNIDDDSRRAMDMINELGVSFPVLFDASKEVSRLYEVDAMPVTVIVDREGNVRHIHQGYKPGYEQQYLDEIRSLLRE
jgi:peroxiredoxin